MSIRENVFFFIVKETNFQVKAKQKNFKIAKLSNWV